MAKAKLVKKKRRLKVEGIATILFTLAIFAYLGATFGLRSYNIVLQQQAQKIESKASTLKEAVANLENEVNTLQNHDRVLGMAEEDGIKTNQENVVTIGKDNNK